RAYKETGVQTCARAIYLTGSTVTFHNTLNGGQALTITGAGVFDGIVGGTTALTSVHVTGASTINTTSIHTTGTQAYDGAATLGEIGRASCRAGAYGRTL